MADETDYTAYPMGTALRAFLASAGVVPANPSDESGAESLVDYDRHAAAAAARWEKATGWIPFLAAESPTTRRIYQEDGARFWDLGGGVIPGTVTGATLYGLYGDATGQALTYDDQYRFEPYLPQNRPHELIRMGYARAGILALTARWGYCTVLPADVYDAILSDAAASLYDSLRGALASGADGSNGGGGGDIQEVQQGELTVRFATSPAERRALYSGWTATVQAAVNRYRRVVIV